MVHLRKSQMNAESRRNDSVAILVHDIIVSGPVTAANLSLAKGLAAERARNVLEDPNSEYCLSRLCDCGKKMDIDASASAAVDADIELQGKSEIALNDETEEGFAKIADMTRIEFEDPDTSKSITLVDETAIDEQVVEDMLTSQDQEFAAEEGAVTAIQLAV
jgi:endoribonuclease Dicer